MIARLRWLHEFAHSAAGHACLRCTPTNGLWLFVSAAMLVVAAGCNTDSNLPEHRISWAGAPRDIQQMVEGYVLDPKAAADSSGASRLFDPRYYSPPTPFFAYAGSDDAVTVALAARVEGSPPPIDVFYTDLYWFQTFEPLWLEPLRQVNGQPLTVPVGARERPLTELLHPDLLKTATFGKELYAAPLSLRGNCLYYRADLVPSPPKTWPELIATAKRVLAEQNPESPLKHGLTLHWQDLHADVYPMLWGYGGGPPGCVDAHGELLAPHLASPGNLAALEMLYRLIHREQLTEPLDAMSRRKPEDDADLYRQFVEGKTLFLIDWTNSAARIDQALRERKRQGKKPELGSAAIGLAPLPHGPNHEQSYSVNSSWGWVVAARPRSPHSMEFVRELVSPKAQLDFFEHYAEVPIYQREELEKLPDWPATSARLAPYHRQLLDLMYARGTEGPVKFMDRPNRKAVNTIIDDAIKDCLLNVPKNAPAAQIEFPRAAAEQTLREADVKVQSFLHRLQHLGIASGCDDEAVLPASTQEHHGT